MTLLGFYGQFGFGSRETVHVWELCREWGGKGPQEGLEGILGRSLDIYGENTRRASMGWLDL